MKGRLARYAPLQLVDYMIERGLVTFGMGALFGWIMVLSNSQRSEDWAAGEQGLFLIKAFFMSTLGLFTWFGTLTAVNGMISNDRVKGTFRFLFAKPISVLWYYTQAWLLHGLGLLLVVCALMALFAVTVRPFFPPAILLFVAVTYVTLGGVGFLLSALTKRDGTLLVVFWLLALVFRTKYSDQTGLVSSLVKVVTPPAPGMSAMVEPIMRGTAVDMTTVYSAIAYGVVCFLLGLVVLRYRPMTA
jgi:hypothetical protein